MYQDYSMGMTEEDAKKLAEKNIEKKISRGDNRDEAIRTEIERAWQLSRIELDESNF